MKNLLKPLSAKIVAVVLVSVLSTLVMGLFVQKNTIRNKTLGVLENEMRTKMIGADRVADSISRLGKDGAFDNEKLIEDLEEVGLENYQDSIIIRTIPIVAAWNAVEEAARESDMNFRIITDQARNKDNMPQNAWEQALHDRMFDGSPEDLFYEDDDQGLIVFAKPIRLEKSCLACHGHPSTSPYGNGKDVLGYPMEDWKEGDYHGMFVLTADTEQIDGPVRESMASSIAFTVPLTVALLGAAVFIVRGINRKLRSIITDLGSSSSELSAASSEVAAASSALAEGASQQAASIEESSASMRDMSQLVDQNAQVAKSTSAFARETSNSASQGVDSMVEMRARVNDVHNAAEEMNTAMLAIKESSDSISKIIRTIDEIAFQTNILSLNAAVEAARAGEAGAGFAVVADEVRNLANRAAEAAKETTSIIEDSISKTEQGAKMNALVVNNLKEVIERAEEVEADLNNISSGVQKVDAAMSELEISVKNQGDGIVHSSNSLEQVSDITQANAAAAEETASSSEVLNNQSDILMRALDQLNEVVTGKAPTYDVREDNNRNKTIPANDSFMLPQESDRKIDF